MKSKINTSFRNLNHFPLTLGILALLPVLLFLIPEASCKLPLTVPSFGQVVPLGTLLDARTVTFLPGSSVFKSGFKIPKETVTRKQAFVSEFHVDPLNSTQSKFGHLSRATILSILSEQVDVEGSWRYLVEEPRGQSIRFKTELKRKWREHYHEKILIEESHTIDNETFFSIPLLLAKNLCVQNLLAQANENATHFVAGISYGKHIAAVFEDRSTLRRYGFVRTRRMLAENPVFVRDRDDNGTLIESHAHTAVRLYTDTTFPLDSEALPRTLEELELYFYEFNDKSEDHVIPLTYELMPLTSVWTFLGGNYTTMSLLAFRWGLENYMGDPYITPHQMYPIYREFDKVSIVTYKAREIMNMLIDMDLDLETVVSNRRDYLENVTRLNTRFKEALSEFKRNLRTILREFRTGLLETTFEEALNGVLESFKKDEYSPEKFARLLEREFGGIRNEISAERIGRTVGNLYREIETMIAM